MGRRSARKPDKTDRLDARAVALFLHREPDLFAFFVASMASARFSKNSSRGGFLRYRSVRFTITGMACAAIQLLLLQLLTSSRLRALPANLAAFAVSAQFNFFLSSTFTWSDRPGGAVTSKWLRFLAAASGTALLNLSLFQLARLVLPLLPAAGAGIVLAAILNFVVADRAVFADHARPPLAARKLRLSRLGRSDSFQREDPSNGNLR
jgi:putative flippase GtrA